MVGSLKIKCYVNISVKTLAFWPSGIVQLFSKIVT